MITLIKEGVGVGKRVVSHSRPAGWIDDLHFSELTVDFSGCGNVAGLCDAIKLELLKSGVLVVTGDDRIRRLGFSWVAETISRGVPQGVCAPILPTVVAIAIEDRTLERLAHVVSATDFESASSRNAVMERLTAIGEGLAAFPIVLVCIIATESSVGSRLLDECNDEILAPRGNLRAKVCFSDSNLLDTVASLLGEKVNSLTNKLSYAIFARGQKEFPVRPQVSYVEVDPCVLSAIRFGYDPGNRHLTPFSAGIPSFPVSLRLSAGYFGDVTRRRLAKLLFATDFRRAVREFTEWDRYVVANVRAYRIEEGVPADSGAHVFHRDFNPEGVARAILYLTDVASMSDGPFVWFDAVSTEETPIYGKRGTLILFCGNKCLHRGSIPKGSFRVALDISLVKAELHEQEGVLFLGLNTWPVDRAALHHFHSHFERAL